LEILFLTLVVIASVAKTLQYFTLFSWMVLNLLVIFLLGAFLSILGSCLLLLGVKVILVYLTFIFASGIYKVLDSKLFEKC